MSDGFGRFIVGIEGNAGRRAEDGFGDAIGDAKK